MSGPAGGAPGPPAPGEVRRLGDAALLLFTGDPTTTRHAADALRQLAWPGVVDVVGGLSSVLVRTEPGRVDVGAMAGELSGRTFAATGPAPTRLVEMPTVFDGPDLAEVGRLTGLGGAGVVAELADTPLQVAVLGFSPGFAYLSGLGHGLAAVPRRDSPRPAVPAGSVAVAGGYAAVYPQATPGGWRLLGRTGRTLFDAAVPPYAVLRPGDTVRFVPVADGDGSSGPPGARSPAVAPAAAAADRRRALRPPVHARAGFDVADGGLLTTVQDRGRRQVAHLGVPGAGPADRRSHALANLLVGNDPGAAALECTMAGPTLVSRADRYVAVVGGSAEVRLDGRPLPSERVVPVAPGQRLQVGPLTGGARTYVAVDGGFAVPEVLGSASTDVLSWLGPPALEAGDRLGVGPASGPLGGHLRPGTMAPPGPAVVLRVLPGPHPEWFGADALNALARTRWAVGPQSNRVALRMGADHPPVGLRPSSRPLASHGVVDGVLQVPAGGLPIALLPDHATLGGYPVVAVVISADLALLGQRPVGSEVTLEPVDGRSAARALASETRALADAVVGRYPVVPG